MEVTIDPVNNQSSDQSQLALESSAQRVPWDGGL